MKLMSVNLFIFRTSKMVEYIKMRTEIIVNVSLPAVYTGLPTLRMLSHILDPDTVF